MMDRQLSDLIENDPELQRLRAELRSMNYQYWWFIAYFAAVALLICVAIAFAFWPIASQAQVAPPPPPCYPMGIKGTSQFKNEWFARTNNGWYAFWVCKNTQGTWDAYGIACRHGVCAQQAWLTTEIAIGSAVNRITETDNQWTANVVMKCDDAIANHTADEPICTDMRNAMHAAVLAINPAPPSPTAKWVVKAPGPRVVYTIFNGRRGALTSPTKYVAAGVACDDKVRTDEILGPIVTTYMGVTVDGVSGLAVCVLQ